MNANLSGERNICHVRFAQCDGTMKMAIRVARYKARQTNSVTSATIG